MGYNLLEVEKVPVPQVLKGKPRWVTCVAFATATLTIITSAITIGIVMGYTYCYIEHRTGLRTGNFSEATNVQIVHLAPPESPEVLGNRTINGALMSSSSVIISRILTLGHALMEEKISHIPPISDGTFS